MKEAPPNLNLKEPKELLNKAVKYGKLKSWGKCKANASKAEKEMNAIKDLYLSVRDLYDILIKKVEGLETYSIVLKDFEKKDSGIHKLIEGGKLKEAKEKTNAAIAEVDNILQLYSNYSALGERIQILRSSSINVPGLDQKVGEIGISFRNNTWSDLQGLIDDAHSMIEQFHEEDKKNEPRAKQMITELHQTLTDAPSFLNLAEATQLFNVAQELYKAKNYIGAIVRVTEATEIIERMKDKYSQVSETINSVQESIDNAKNEEGYGFIDFDSMEQTLEIIKKMVTAGDLDLAINYSKNLLNELETAKRPYIDDIRTKTDNWFRSLWSEVYNIDQAGLDVTEVKDVLLNIQKELKSATDYSDYVKVDDQLMTIDASITNVRQEYGLLSDIPSYISYKLSEASDMVYGIAKLGVDVSDLEFEVEELRTAFASAIGDEEMMIIKGKLEPLFFKIDKTKEIGVEIKNTRYYNQDLLDKILEKIKDLEEKGYETKRLVFEHENKTKLLVESKSVKALELVQGMIEEMLTLIESVFNKNPKLFNLQQEVLIQQFEVKKSLNRVKDEGLDLSTVEERKEQFLSAESDVDSIEELTKLAEIAKSILKDIEQIYEDTLNEKEKFGRAKEELNRIMPAFEFLNGWADLSSVKQNINLAGVAMLSKRSAKALELLEVAKEEMENLKEVSSASVEVTMDTGSLSPNLWDQSKLILTNNGKVSLKNINISIDGPLEVRKIKTVELMDPAEEKQLDIGVMFKGGGKIPLDFVISAFRGFDNTKMDFQKDVWVTVTGAPAASAPASAAPIPVAAPSQPSTPTPAAATDSGDAALSDEVVIKLKQLAQLRNEGIISPEDFEKKKSELLSQF